MNEHKNAALRTKSGIAWTLKHQCPAIQAPDIRVERVRLEIQ
jgi:hypothetical protein